MLNLSHLDISAFFKACGPQKKTQRFLKSLPFMIVRNTLSQFGRPHLMGVSNLFGEGGGTRRRVSGSVTRVTVKAQGGA